MKRTVSCRIGDRWVRGEFTIDADGGMVCVEYKGRSRSAQIGGSPPLAIAQLVLGELVKEAEAH